MPECEEAAGLYVTAQTQWRRHPSGLVAGFDYPGVEAAARMAGIEMTSELFAQLRLLETHTIKIAAETRQNDGNED